MMPALLSPYLRAAPSLLFWPLRICAYCHTEFDPSWSNWPPIEQCCDESCRRRALRFGFIKGYRETARMFRKLLPR